MTHFKTLEDVMARLRAEDGCPWDREQTHESIKICLLEETAEVLEAIDSGNDELLVEELGDLLLQVVFHSQIAKEGDRFTLKQVVEGITNKLIVRHPHVFGDKECADADAVVNQWEKIKQSEKKEERKSVMDGIPNYLSALHFSEKALKKARKADISIDNFTPTSGSEEKDAIAAELFDVVQRAAAQGLSCEEILRQANNDFVNFCRQNEK